MFKKLFEVSRKELKRLSKTADQVLSLEDEFKKLSDTELQNKTIEFKERFGNGETLDNLLVEA